MQFGVLQEYPIFADAKMVVPGGSDSPEAEKIHIAPVRVMPTLGFLVTFYLLRIILMFNAFHLFKYEF